VLKIKKKFYHEVKIYMVKSIPNDRIRNDWIAQYLLARENQWSDRKIKTARKLKKWTNRYRHVLPFFLPIHWSYEFRMNNIIQSIAECTRWNFENIIPVSKHCNYLFYRTRYLFYKTNLSVTVTQLFPSDHFPNSLVIKTI